MLFGLKILPLGLDLVVQLQHGAGLGLLDAQLVAAFHGLAEDNGVDTLFLVVRVDGDEQQVHGVVPAEGLENVDPAGGHEAAPVLLQGGGQAWRTYAEGHHAVVFIHDEAGGVGIDEGRELGGVLFDLAVREIHSAVQRRVGQVDQLEKRLEQGQIGQAVPGLVNVQTVALENEVGDLLPALYGGLVLRDGDKLLDPVHVLHIAQGGHVVDVVGIVVVCEKAAAAVKALHQHTLAVHVGEAEGTVNGGAVQLLRPDLHRAEQGGGDLRVVNEIHLGKAQAVGTPLVVGLAGVDGTDAAHDLPVAHGQPAAGVAVFKGGVLAAVPIGEIVAIGGGDELRHVFIQFIWVVHEPAQLGFVSYFYNGDHLVYLLYHANTHIVYDIIL